jgi:ABC-type phosphate transport system substrate-binding protein
MRARLLIVIAVVAALPAWAPLAQTTSSPIYRLIVNPANPEAVVTRRFVEDAFLKKIKTWPNGEVIRPADLAPNAPVRRQFTEQLLKRPVDAVRAYWQKLIFSGRDVPPPEFDTDADVVRYVKKHTGAMGYVSASTPLDGTKVLSIEAN